MGVRTSDPTGGRDGGVGAVGSVPSHVRVEPWPYGSIPDPCPALVRFVLVDERLRARYMDEASTVSALRRDVQHVYPYRLMELAGLQLTTKPGAACAAR